MLLGAHMSVAGGVSTAFARAEKVGCTALQIFVKNANQWAAKPIGEEEIRRFAAERRRTGIERVVAHDSYLINLGSPDTDLWKRSIDALVDELERCESLALDGLVAHPGAHMGTGEDAGLARISSALDAVHARTKGFRALLLLEATAGSGTHLGASFEHLRRIRDGVREPERVAYCIDTCHVFAAGYEMRTPEGVRDTLDRFDSVCGLEFLRAIHLNDSLTPFASRRDRHAHIGEGAIGRAGFEALVREPRVQRIPMVLETPKGEDLREDARNLDVLRGLAEGRAPRLGDALDTPEWNAGLLRDGASKSKTQAKVTAKSKAKSKAKAKAKSKAKGKVKSRSARSSSRG